jgi:hypothetical protein
VKDRRQGRGAGLLLEVGRQLAWAEAGCALWPGDGLLLPTQSGENL